NKRNLPPDEAVEKGRFADIGTPENGDGSGHCGSLKVPPEPGWQALSPGLQWFSGVVVGAGCCWAVPWPAGCCTVGAVSDGSGNWALPGIASSRVPGSTVSSFCPVSLLNVLQPVTERVNATSTTEPMTLRIELISWSTAARAAR